MHFIKILLTIFIIISGLNGKNLKQVSNRGLGNVELLDIYIHENTAFVPGGLGGLNIIDISDPSDITVLSEYSAYGCEYGRLYAWTVSGDFAYGTGRDCGVIILDISDINHPLSAGEFGDNSFRYEHPSSSNNLLFLSRHQHGIEIVDISTRDIPSTLSEIPTTNAWASLPENQILYIADGSGGLRIIDISSPSDPILLSVLPTSGSARDLDKVGNHILLAVGAAGVDLVDVSDPGNPIFIDNYNTTGFASRVSANDSLVAVSDWDDIEVLRFDDQGLSLAGYKNNGKRVMATAMVNNYIFSAEWLKFTVYEYGQVNGADLDMESQRIEFSRTHPNESQTQSITLQNNGNTILNINPIESTNPDFNYNVSNTSIPPNSSSVFSVTYSPNSGGWNETIAISSNDASLQNQSLRSFGNFSYGPMPGDFAPDFELPIVNGFGNLSLNDLIGSPTVLAFFATW